MEFLELEDISSIVDVEKKSQIDVSIPGVEGFKVQIKYITSDEVEKIKDSCTKATFNPTTGQKEFTVDYKCFYQSLISRIITDQKGLKAKHLKSLLPINSEKYKELNPESEIKFSQKNLKFLADYSAPFVNFIVSEVNNIKDINSDVNEVELEKN